MYIPTSIFTKPVQGIISSMAYISSTHQILFATISYLLTPSMPCVPPPLEFFPVLSLSSLSFHLLAPSGSSAYIHLRLSSPTSTMPHPPTLRPPSTTSLVDADPEADADREDFRRCC